MVRRLDRFDYPFRKEDTIFGRPEGQIEKFNNKWSIYLWDRAVVPGSFCQAFYRL